MDETSVVVTASPDVDIFVAGVVVAGFAVSPSSLVAIWAAGIVAGFVVGIVVPLRELVLVPSWRRELVNSSDPVLGFFSSRLIVLGGEVVEGPVSLLSSCDLKSSWFSACWT